ncbi:MAG: hypothetical protein JW800_02455 [Candidatus Omnitrophica bacterium]|nr:hypothetical protein [Candidatus Omnitrophota bacterium]
MRLPGYVLLVSLMCAVALSGCGEKKATSPSAKEIISSIEKKIAETDTEGAYKKTLREMSKSAEEELKAEEPMPLVVTKEDEEIVRQIEEAKDEAEELFDTLSTIEEEVVTETIEDVDFIEEPEVPGAVALSEEDLLAADFEGWPNNVGGEMGVYGSLEPDWDEVTTTPYSWVFEPVTPGYNTKDIHAGRQSFRLVTGLGTKSNEGWGSFAMDLGPTVDVTTMPKKVESLDVSKYKYLVFWAKGKKGGEKMKFIARDAHALDYMPQAEYPLPALTTSWQKLVIPLGAISSRVDLSQMDNIGLAFGSDVGNQKGDIAFIDNFIFTNSE